MAASKHSIFTVLFCMILKVSDDLSPECDRLVGRKRIRKEVNRLTPKEKFHLNFAMKLAMASPPYYPKNSLVFKDIANYHGAPYTICTGPCCPHSDRLPEFLVWHRLYTGISANSFLP